ncbi:Na+/H+ antiporter NhaA [Microlunatus sp. GCM10028923]|uniref:Na+/H+ antiporter NhaA n=1 Tax=Microlunatus sp. GCM10028923 TaxID=3273400 RepID=UPI003614DE8C
MSSPVAGGEQITPRVTSDSTPSLPVQGSLDQGPPDPALIRLERGLFRFSYNEPRSAALLLAATVLALIWANLPGGTYQEFWHTELGVALGPYELSLDLKHWVNDGLMAFFFFAVGLEVKKELAIGELNDRSRAVVPIVAALAGLALPALIFLVLNASGPGAGAWGVVVSTDTAFVLGVLALVGPRRAARLRLFIMALAVTDDIGALLIIALFYTESINLPALGAAVIGFGLIFVLRRLRVARGAGYFVVGIATWVAMYLSGVHPTLAGVVIALLLPVFPPKRQAVERAAQLARAFRQSPSAKYSRAARVGLTTAVSVNERLQIAFHPVNALVIVPLFALANAGITLHLDTLTAAFGSMLTWGIVAGLVIGKLVGIAGAATAVTRARPGSLPPGLTLPQIVGGAALSGIGFTISLFIVDLALTDPVLQDQARVGVFLASLIAAGLGAVIFFAIRGQTRDLGPPLELLRPVDPERDHIRGRPDATYTLIEYGDFECPFCSRATGSIREVREFFGDDLRYVFRHLPLERQHPQAYQAALASEAAAEQGKFWEMHDLLFAHSDALEPEQLRGYAEQLGLDLDAFDEALRTRAHAGRVNDDLVDAETSELTGTPAFYIGDERLTGPYDAQRLIWELSESAPPPPGAITD